MAEAVAGAVGVIACAAAGIAYAVAEIALNHVEIAYDVEEIAFEIVAVGDEIVAENEVSDSRDVAVVDGDDVLLGAIVVVVDVGVNVVVDDGELVAVDDALVEDAAEPDEDVDVAMIVRGFAVAGHVEILADNDHRKASFVAPPFSLSSAAKQCTTQLVQTGSYQHQH